MGIKCDATFMVERIGDDTKQQNLDRLAHNKKIGGVDGISPSPPQKKE